MCVCSHSLPQPPNSSKTPPSPCKVFPQKAYCATNCPSPLTAHSSKTSSLKPPHPTHTHIYSPPSVTSTPQSFFFSLRLCALINYSSIPSRLGSTSSTETSDGQLPATSLPPEQKKTLRNMAVITDLRCDSAELGCC